VERTDATAFPPPIAELLRLTPLAPLGPGSPDQAVKGKLEALDRDGLAERVTERRMADCCRAGLWLAFGFLDRSHEISQEIPTTEGSYWHALMHRREPDHSNAAYWLRRVGAYSIHADLARVAAELGYPGKGATWDAFAFNDACERHRGRADATEELLRRVQRAEWELLFSWCFARAVGAA
jgi:hypothetical protein